MENPYNVEIVEAEAARLPDMLKDADYAVINSNYAINAGLNPVKDSLAIEGSSSAYANILAVKEGNENSPKILTLKAALESRQVASFIESKYNGSVVSTVTNPGNGYDDSVDYDALKGQTITVAASPTPVEKQAVFYNTHPAIIEQEVFDKVQEIRQQRHRRTKTGKSSLFSGMVYCADCGAKMRYCTTNYFEKRQDHFVCANYRSNTGSCSAHFIRAVVLEDLVWMHMRTVISYVSRYEDHFRAVMEQKLRLSSEAAIRGHKKRLAQAEKRLGELDRLFIRIYEDNVAGKLSDERFALMSKTYEDEQAQLKVEIQTLQQEIEVQERQIENLEQFIQRVRKYEDLDELTPYALRELVKAIYIEAPDKSSGKRYQGIRISYDLVGFIPVEELLKQETA